MCVHVCVCACLFVCVCVCVCIQVQRGFGAGDVEQRCRGQRSESDPGGQRSSQQIYGGSAHAAEQHQV